jgi:hypothetical protein
MCPVSDQISHLEAILDGFPEADKDTIFRRTAARVYRIPSVAVGQSQEQSSAGEAVRGVVRRGRRDEPRDGMEAKNDKVGK